MFLRLGGLRRAAVRSVCVAWLVMLASAIILVPGLSHGESIERHLRNPETLLKAGCTGRELLLLEKDFFVVCYHRGWRIPKWVAYYLTAPDLEGDVGRTEDFREDRAISREGERSKLSDYSGSGYDRGHMAPADAFDRSIVAMSTTFLLSNMAPQTSSLNRGRWKSLEGQVQKVINAHRGVWIVTGNLFADERRVDSIRTFMKRDAADLDRNDRAHWIGNGRVAVPTHSFKAILVAQDSGELGAYGFILPNQRSRLPGEVPFYQVKVDEIERLVDADFFSELGNVAEDRLEADVPSWPPRRERRG